MAEWKNSRQRSLFATLDEEKKCSKCGEVKTVDQFYSKKSRHGTQYLSYVCKRCENRRRCKNVIKSKGKQYKSRADLSREAEERRAAERAARRLEPRKARKKTRRQVWREGLCLRGLGDWCDVVIRWQSQIHNSERKTELREWEVKCNTVVRSIRLRTFKGSGKDTRVCMTWEQRCEAAKRNLAACIKRPEQDAWMKKCENATRKLRRRELNVTH